MDDDGDDQRTVADDLRFTEGMKGSGGLSAGRLWDPHKGDAVPAAGVN